MKVVQRLIIVSHIMLFLFHPKCKQSDSLTTGCSVYRLLRLVVRHRGCRPTCCMSSICPDAAPIASLHIGNAALVWLSHQLRLKPNTHRRRRRDSTVELSCVGGVYALVGCRDPIYNSSAYMWLAQKIGNWVTTDDMVRSHRRRNSTRQLSCVGVGGVYWA